MNLLPAVSVEARKAISARVVISTTILLTIGIALLTGATGTAAAGGDPAMAAKLGPIAAQGGWPGLLATVSQITAAGGLLAFGVVLSWLLGREFADGTITGLFALPVSRPALALAKLLVYLVWTVVIALLLVLVVVLLGLVTGAGAPDGQAWAGLARLLMLTLLTALLAVPAGWAATLGRGLLPGIATTVGLIALAQVAVVAGAGGWFPLAAPAVWALVPGSVSIGQLALVPLIPIGFCLLTLVAWHRLELDT